MNVCGPCGQDFSSLELFDRHRVGKYEYLYDAWDESKSDGRRCLGPEGMAELGWHIDTRGRWTDRERSQRAGENLRGCPPELGHRTVTPSEGGGRPRAQPKRRGSKPSVNTPASKEGTHRMSESDQRARVG